MGHLLLGLVGSGKGCLNTFIILLGTFNGCL